MYPYEIVVWGIWRRSLLKSTDVVAPDPYHIIMIYPSCFIANETIEEH